MSVNSLLLQKQLRENAANLEEFAKDLKCWGEEMKNKEKESKIGAKEVCTRFAFKSLESHYVVQNNY